MRDVFQPCTYILANHKNGTIYIGVTSNLTQRMWQHRNGTTGGFAGRYRTYRLVHFELFGTMEIAIGREKQLKRWHRQWKVNLIEADNPDWRDIAFDIGAGPIAPAMDAETSSA
ncbi:endonuclease [Sphingopyxis sp. H038]|uniref:GIY-YIG nuclease family protein n=1 Tax=unclassified Sphingopyxis TaxID=2614943 RepID=UPI0007309FCD|nr:MULTISPECIES: GIY-YIG nuclease family protein [unclassified Sphingopyxis]KTE01248.1 endonuclease [Sphingopyxis sp. H012]KTE04982.1 endonuclease [Sphingopyxis sp. H093]KTE12795.1 endonuclease [Sphingopyxis sp. H053]KTE26780.1 endonuclease [Sphingopyxis sp. H080]KTE34868.1 endonuclease [Sphingopyxis sp. H038]